MIMWVVAAAVAGTGGSGEAAFREWRQCIGETTRVAAQAGRVPEDMPTLLHAACPEQRAHYLAKSGGKPADVGRMDATLGDYLRRYAFFYTTGLWPAR